MKIGPRTRLAVALGLFASFTGARVARADGAAASAPSNSAEAPSAAAVAEARARFNRGLALYKDGDLPSALAELRKADALAPSYRLKYNIGQVCEEQHDYACAVTAFQAYLTGGGSEIPRARRGSVEAEIQKIAPFVAELRISVDDAGAEISVDDVVVGTSPLTSPVKVSSGVRRVSARHGAAVATRSVEVAGGDRLDVALTLRADTNTQVAPSASAPAAAVSAQNPARDKKPTIVWVGWAGAGAFAIGSAVTGVLALHASHELADQRGIYPGSQAQLTQMSSRVSHLALAADVLGVLALASAGTALYFTFTPETEGARASGGTASLSGRF